MMLILFTFILSSFSSLCQIKTEFLFEFGNFSHASSFTISANGIIYVTDINKNEILSFDTLGNKIKDVGGFGWQLGLFDQPVDIYSNPLVVYVADKNNHRIQQLDRNLNFIASFENKSEDVEQRFGFPLAVSVSNQGDLYLLDGENLRVIKLDLFGNFITNFGGYDAGKYKLKKPVSLAIDKNERIYLLDDNFIRIFDNFGNHLISIDVEKQLKSIRIVFDKIVIVTSDSIIKFEPLASNYFKDITPSNLNIRKVVSALIFNQKLYVLFFDKIKVFKVNY